MPARRSRQPFGYLDRLVADDEPPPQKLSAETCFILRLMIQACLAPAPVLSPDEIKAIREAENVSQPVFARYLNVSKNLVSDWERGAKKPGGPALRLLSIIQRSGLDAVA